MILTLILAAALPQAGVCKKLSDEYETASKRLAQSVVEDHGPAGDRHMADIRAQAGQTLELIKANRCKPPTSTPSPNPYYSKALGCFSDRVRTIDDVSGKEPESCDITKWVRSGE